MRNQSGSSLLLLLGTPVIGIVGFAAAFLIYDLTGFSPLPVEDYGAVLSLSICSFWVAAVMRDGAEEIDDTSSPARHFQEIFCISLGLALLSQALLTYSYALLLVDATLPFPVVVGGSLISSALLTLAWPLLHPRPADAPAGVLLVGFDIVVASLLPVLRKPILGVVDPEPSRIPFGIPYLGGLVDLDAVVATHRPARIVVNRGIPGFGIFPRPQASEVLLKLLRYRAAGTIVEPAAAAYERLLDRISVRNMEPSDFFAATTLSTKPQMLAIQSVYNNLIGLALLAALLPLMLLLVIAIRIFSSPGPAIETVECVGFQKIPFRMMQFRTRNRGGELSGVGRLLLRLHLVSLPQLINVNRGEMVLFGPRPIRIEFAEELAAMIPFYAHRFSVRPGILSWSQVHLQAETVPPDEWLRLEYDLFYTKQSSPLLDFKILFSAAFGRRSPRFGAESERGAGMRRDGESGAAVSE